MKYNDLEVEKLESAQSSLDGVRDQRRRTVRVLVVFELKRLFRKARQSCMGSEGLLLAIFYPFKAPQAISSLIALREKTSFFADFAHPRVGLFEVSVRCRGR